MKMEATVQKPGLLSRPQGIALAILAAVAIWSFSPVSPLTAVLLIVVALFLFGLRRPVWAVAALLVSQLTVTSYMVNTPFGIAISLRLMLLILIGLVLWRSSAQERIELGPKAKRVLIPASIVIGLSVVANIANSGFDYAFKDFRYMMVGLLIVIFLAAVTRNLKDFKILCAMAFIGMIASAIIAVMQHYQFLGMGQNTLIPGFLQGWEGQPRVPGIAETELELSFTLPVVALAVLGICLARRVNSGTTWLLGASVVLMGLALYFTYTRSALLGLAFGLVALPLFLKTRIRGEIILAVLLLGLISIETTGIMRGVYFEARGQTVQEESATERKILWQAGIAIAMDNPVLGIGGDQFRYVSPQYASAVDPALVRQQEEYWSYRTLGGQAPHNDFLKVWVCYGTLALAAYLWLFSAVLQNFLDSYRASNGRFIKGLSIGLAAALVAYGVNAFYHNSLAAMPLFWILAGFSVATAKLALNRKRHNQSRQTLPQTSGWGEFDE